MFLAADGEQNLNVAVLIYLSGTSNPEKVPANHPQMLASKYF
jgi:hypothetical protein